MQAQRHTPKHVPTRPFAITALLTFAGAFSLAAQGDAPSRIRAYVTAYQRAFTALIAEEVTVQNVSRSGRANATRTTEGEIFAVFVDEGAAWMTVHDVRRVDDEPVAPQTTLFDRLARGDGRRLAPEVAAANARYNIGSVSRNFNEPTLALQLLSRARAAEVAFERARQAEAIDGVACLAVGFRLRDDASFIRSQTRRRVRVTGRVVATEAAGVVYGTSLTIDDGRVTSTLDTSYEPSANVGLLVPTTFLETYRDRSTGELIAVRSAFSNYRRFEAAGRVIPQQP